MRKLTPIEIELHRIAVAWHGQQVRLISAALGDSWPLHERWIVDELTRRAGEIVGCPFILDIKGRGRSKQRADRAVR